jgi:flagellar hook-associated protein 2
MSSAGITFGGLASGLDTKAIIAALVAVERQPITLLENKKTALAKSKSMMGDFKALLDKLNDAGKALKATTDFLSMKATVAGTDFLSATASSSAAPGSYQITVNQLALAQVNSSAGVATRTTQITSNSSFDLAITVNGTAHYVTGIQANPTPEQLAAAINSADDTSDIGVRADVIDTGDPTNPVQLVLRSKTTGSQGAFTVAIDSGPTGGAMDAFISGLNSGVHTTAQDAHIDINGIAVTRSTNTITDAIAGVSLDLHSLTPANATPPPARSATTLTISTDAEATSAKVKTFVDAYNAVVDYVTAQNVVDGQGKASSPLFGDSTLRSVRDTLRSTVGAVVSTGNLAYSMLAQTGITSDKEGKLTFNQSKFETALTTDEQAVSRLFTGAATGGGIAGTLTSVLDSLTDSVAGVFKARNDGYDSIIKDTQRQIDSGNDRLTRYEQQLQQQYANLETLMSQLQGQGQSLGSLRTISSS